MVTKKHYSFSIEPETVDVLNAIEERLGLSKSEQVRRALALWLDSLRWPERSRTDRSPTRGGRRATPRATG